MERSMDMVFENDEWAVTEAGLEHKGIGYFIEREQLGMRRTDGLWNWPLQLAEKTWYRPQPFAEALAQALRAYDIAPDAALAASFSTAGRDGEARIWDRIVRALGRPQWDLSIDRHEPAREPIETRRRPREQRAPARVREPA